MSLSVHAFLRRETQAIIYHIALDSGMEQMRYVMQQGDSEAMLSGFVNIFSVFWSKNQLLIRRVHGIAAIDPEFGAAVESRNRRRRMAAARVVEIMNRQRERQTARPEEQQAATLCALTSFEFFDVLAENCGSAAMAAGLLPEIVKKVLKV
jgi:hypothetical protein